MTRILFGSFGVPVLGGSSTASYALFGRMQADGRDVHYINLIHGDQRKLRNVFGPATGNPEGLENVTNCWLDGRVTDDHPEIEALVGQIDPDINVGVGFVASMLMKAAIPEIPLALLTGTCRQAQDYVTSGRAKDAIALLERAGTASSLGLVNRSERTAMERSDLIIAHSPLTLQCLLRFFPELRGKMYSKVVSFSEWICEAAEAGRHHARDFARRDIDALFIASDWDRPEKNYRLVATMAKGLRARSIHIVGDVPYQIKGAVHHGFVATRSELFALLGRSRSVVCPSLMDAAPGILFEGSVLGCNVIASKNCGNWQICNEALLVDPFAANGFIKCIERGADRKYRDNLETFLALRCYDDLMDALDAFASQFASTAQL